MTSRSMVVGAVARLDFCGWAVELQVEACPPEGQCPVLVAGMKIQQMISEPLGTVNHPSMLRTYIRCFEAILIWWLAFVFTDHTKSAHDILLMVDGFLELGVLK